MRVAVITAFWQRPAISALYWQGIQRIAGVLTAQRVGLETVAVVSPDDAANEALARRHATITVRAPNAPLAQKWNAASLTARRLRPDYVLIMGSDDLLSDSLARGLAAAMRAGVDHSGLLDFYLYDSVTGRAAYWPGYPLGHRRRGRSIGVGRFYSARILRVLDWALWPASDRPSGMDGLADERLLAHGFALEARRSADWGGVAVDVKSGENVWGFERFARRPADAVLVRALFPELAGLGVAQQPHGPSVAPSVPPRVGVA